MLSFETPLFKTVEKSTIFKSTVKTINPLSLKFFLKPSCRFKFLPNLSFFVINFSASQFADASRKMELNFKNVDQLISDSKTETDQLSGVKKITRSF